MFHIPVLSFVRFSLLICLLTGFLSGICCVNASAIVTAETHQVEISYDPVRKKYIQLKKNGKQPVPMQQAQQQSDLSYLSLQSDDIDSNLKKTPLYTEKDNYERKMQSIRYVLAKERDIRLLSCAVFNGTFAVWVGSRALNEFGYVKNRRIGILVEQKGSRQIVKACKRHGISYVLIEDSKSLIAELMSHSVDIIIINESDALELILRDSNVHYRNMAISSGCSIKTGLPIIDSKFRKMIVLSLKNYDQFFKSIYVSS